MAFKLSYKRCEEIKETIINTFEALNIRCIPIKYDPILKPNVDNLRYISSLLGCNSLEAKKKLNERIIFTKKATDILDAALKLKANGIAYLTLQVYHKNRTYPPL